LSEWIIELGTPKKVAGICKSGRDCLVEAKLIVVRM